MIYGVYCVKDRLVGWLPPQLDQDDNTAVRNFAMAVKTADPKSLIGFKPKDFDLYKMGTFDSEKGVFDCGIPEFLIAGDIAKGVDRFEDEA